MTVRDTLRAVLDIVPVVIGIGLFLASAFQQNRELMKEAAWFVCAVCLINIFFFWIHRVGK